MSRNNALTPIGRFPPPLRAACGLVGVLAVASTLGSGAVAAAATGPSIVSLAVAPRVLIRTSAATVNVTAKDPGHRVTLRYRWLRNGELVANATSRSIELSRHAFRKGDRLRVRVTAVAGTRSTIKTSAAVIVGDAAPKVTSLAIDPAAPTRRDTLSATLRASDVDGDRLTQRRTWSWTCPGSPSGSVVAATIAPADLGIRQGCRVSLTDRVADGQKAVSAAAAAVVVGDRAPVISSVGVDPATPTTDQTVHAAVGAGDPDGDPISLAYQWAVNGTPVAGATDATFDLSVPGNGDRGDQVSVSVTASDGAMTAEATSAPATITNSLPILSRATVVYDWATATAAISRSVTDADGDPLQTSIRWTIDGFDAGTSSTLDVAGAGAHVGDVIGALVRVTDSQGGSSAWVAARPDPVTAGVPAAPPMHDWYPYTEPDGSAVRAIMQVASDPAHLDVLTAFGFTRSSDSGVTWSHAFGPCDVDGSAAAYAPSAPNIVYAGCTGQGTYRSDDDGATWHAIPFVTNSPLDGGAKALAVDPGDPDVVFDVCGNCWWMGGIWRTTDGGQTWQNVATMPTLGFSVAIDPDDPEHIVVGTTNGVVVSRDGGDPWSGPYGPGGMIAAFDPGSGALWGILDEASTSSVLRSDDGGTTWTTIPGSPTELTALAAAGGDVYVGDKNNYVSQSTDDGATWTTTGLATNTRTGGPVDTIAIDPTTPGPVCVGFAGGGVWGVSFRPDLPSGREVYKAIQLDSITDITPTSVTVNATVAPVIPGDWGLVTWYWGDVLAPSANEKVTPVTGTDGEQSVSTTLTGLAPNTTYHLEADAFFNDIAGGAFRGGSQETFTTPPA